jgi:hypothetical protein
MIINKILRDLKFMNLINEDVNGKIRPYLNMLYVVGFEQGKKSLGGHKKVKLELYVWGVLKDSFDSEKEAAKITKDSETTIRRSLRSGIATKKGHIWKYKKKPVENPKLPDLF